MAEYRTQLTTFESVEPHGHKPKDRRRRNDYQTRMKNVQRKTWIFININSGQSVRRQVMKLSKLSIPY